jgi:hypothetical protein
LFAIYLHELFALLKIEKADKQEDDGGCHQEYTALKDGALPDERVYVSWEGEWVKEDVPKRGSEEIGGVHKDEKDETKQYHYYRRAVAATGDCREHKREVAEKQHREDELGGHLKNVDGVKQQPGYVSKQKYDEIVGYINHQHAYSPDFVTIVGDAEYDFEDTVVVVILYAEDDGVENQQQARKHQQTVDSSFVDFVAIPRFLKHKESEECKCGKQEPEKLACKNDFEVVANDAAYECNILVSSHNLNF